MNVCVLLDVHSYSSIGRLPILRCEGSLRLTNDKEWIVSDEDESWASSMGILKGSLRCAFQDHPCCICVNVVCNTPSRREWNLDGEWEYIPMIEAAVKGVPLAAIQWWWYMFCLMFCIPITIYQLQVVTFDVYLRFLTRDPYRLNGPVVWSTTTFSGTASALSISIGHKSVCFHRARTALAHCRGQALNLMDAFQLGNARPGLCVCGGPSRLPFLGWLLSDRLWKLTERWNGCKKNIFSFSDGNSTNRQKWNVCRPFLISPSF